MFIKSIFYDMWKKSKKSFEVILKFMILFLPMSSFATVAS